MTDETLNQGTSPAPALDVTPAPTPVLEPEPVLTPAPEPIPTPAPDLTPTPEPVLEPAPAPPSMEVISVAELIDRLTTGDGETDASPEESQAPVEPPPADPGDTLAVEIDPGTLAVLDSLGDIKRELVLVSDQMAEIQLHQTRPVLTTSFEDYTVMEGLLLLLFLAAFAAACAKILKGGLSWLKS